MKSSSVSVRSDHITSRLCRPVRNSPRVRASCALSWTSRRTVRTHFVQEKRRLQSTYGGASLAPVAGLLFSAITENLTDQDSGTMSEEESESNSSRYYFGNPSTRVQSSFVFSGPVFVILMVMMVTLVVVIVLGNALVIVAFKVDKSLRRQCNYYFLNLAISDFLVGKSNLILFFKIIDPGITEHGAKLNANDECVISVIKAGFCASVSMLM